MHLKFVFVSLMNKRSIKMNTKDFILQKTFILLLEKGYDGVSISDIQQATGLARGLLYHYFGNKERLFSEIIACYFVENYSLDREALKNKSVGELIGFMTDWYGGIYRELVCKAGTGVSFLSNDFLFYQLARHDEPFASVYKSVRELRFAVWKTALLNSFSKGELRSGLNLESVARQFVYITEGASLNAYVKTNMHDVISGIEKGLQDFFEIIKR